MTFEPGTVWLVGAGPGDPELLTVHAARALAEADVVLHDALVSPEILALAPQARLEPVGKRAGGRRTPQLRINERLISLAREGHRVVRLKGGDPLVFGRGGEEALALAAAGDPLPHRPRGQRRHRRSGSGRHSGHPSRPGAQRCVRHRSRRQGRSCPDLDWSALARGADVLVLYMALRQIGVIAAHLRAAGRAGRRTGRVRYRGDHAAPARGDHHAGGRGTAAPPASHRMRRH